ncbi:hypothetical protein IPZ68_32365 [Streptomyces arenae]|nr:hypothetical protein [Streptomyces arenae]
MTVVACVLLPVLALLLYAMDRVEEKLLSQRPGPRHARTRHLRLIRGGAHGRVDAERRGHSRRQDAA